MSNIRVRVDLSEVPPDVDIRSIAAQIAEIVRNIRGREVQVDINDHAALSNRAKFYKQIGYNKI